ncbi:MAG: hypothetical protein ABJF25_04330 [Rhodopirellula bahusiensis]
MGFGDPGCYGGGGLAGASTPNIDRLAAEGLKLTSCYAQQTCTPTLRWPGFRGPRESLN